MALRYCFEESKVLRTLSASRKSDLAVIDTDGISTAAIKAALYKNKNSQTHKRRWVIYEHIKN